LVAGVSLCLALGLAFASTQWRLPDLKRLPPAQNIVGTQEFDLLGISACANRIYLPNGLTAGWPINPRQVRLAYDPRHLQIAFRAVPGVPRILESGASGEVSRIWPIAIRRQLGCYLAHRAAVFSEQMGLAKAGVFYPAESGIIANPYGLHLAHPQTAATVVGYIGSRAPELWRRPFLLYIAAPLVVGFLWLRRHPLRLVATALLGGAFAYPAFLFVAAPAADARYIFPSSIFCAFLIAAGVANLIDDRPRRALSGA
jgi:hypothetical protein